MDLHEWEFGYLLNQFVAFLLHSKNELTKNTQHSPLLSIPLIGFIVLLIILLFVIRKIFLIRKSFKETSILLKLTPPAFTEKTAYTTQQLFSVIHNLGERRSIWDKLLGRKTRFSFEIASTLNQGIRYLIRTTPEEINNVKRNIISYLPHISVQIVNEYLPENIEKLNKFHTKVVEFKLKKHFAYPLQKQDILIEHDPVAYITGMMTKLSPGELISFQIVLSPTTIAETNTLSRMILNNEDVLRYLERSHFPIYTLPLIIVFKIFFKLLQVFASNAQWAMTEIMHPSTQSTYLQQTNLYKQQLQTMNHLKPARVLSVFEQEAIKSIQEKIEQPLFETTIRLLVIMKDKNDQKERVKGFISSLATYSVPKYQSLVKKRSLLKLSDKTNLLTFRKRLLSLINNKSLSLLSVSEISDLYHFPFAQINQTENIVKVHSKELPAPLSLKKEKQDLDVVFAKNSYGGTTTEIGLAKEERVRHMYVIGATGTGKSTLMLSMINQDLNNGKGVCVIDPHGDLAKASINYIPNNRVNDLIYFNPFDIKYPIGINLLELTPGLDEDDSLIEKEFIAESVISLFRKVFSDAWSSHPHRIEYILRNTIYTAFTLENPTLFTIFDLLNNPVLQKKAIQGLQDENLKNFWKYEFGRAGDYQKVKMVAPVTARIGRFLFSPSAKRILEQERSTINFDQILDQKKILICNLSKGNIGEDTSEVMGIMILNKIQLAALKRARVESKKRNDFYLYVDEFQNFATPSFIQMLSEARKYGLNLVMAEQSTSQQRDKNLVNIILANTGTVITFRSANPADEQLLLPQFSPYIEQGEIANLPSYHFYMKKAAMIPEEPFSGETMPVTITKDPKKWQNLIQASRDNNATIYMPKQKNINIKENGQETKAEFIPESSGMPA